jgi:hypothetical protein
LELPQDISEIEEPGILMGNNFLLSVELRINVTHVIEEKLNVEI